MSNEMENSPVIYTKSTSENVVRNRNQQGADTSARIARSVAVREVFSNLDGPTKVRIGSFLTGKEVSETVALLTLMDQFAAYIERGNEVFIGVW